MDCANELIGAKLSVKGCNALFLLLFPGCIAYQGFQCGITIAF